MKAVVVYESLWGNTAAIARAVAEGFGPDARALTTDEATGRVVAEADVIVAGAPVIGFSLANERARENIAMQEIGAPTPPDTSHPSLRHWLAELPAGDKPVATFETRIWWSLRGATGTIEHGFRRAGYRTIAKGEKFIVDGKYGPLREGEVERAREWGKELALAAERSKQGPADG
jgi:flavodoxin